MAVLKVLTKFAGLREILPMIIIVASTELCIR